MLEAPQASPVAPGEAEAPERASYALGFDLGFASSPTAGALLDFTGNEPRLVEVRTFRPRCGGTWQHRQSDILEQVKAWLAIEILPFYPPLLLAYSCAHLQERREEDASPHRKSKNERAVSTKVLNAQTALKLAELCGGIRGLAVGFGLPCVGVQESESKVALASDSQASKGDMIRAARRIFGRDFTEHEADAIGHTWAGEANYRRDVLIRTAEARRAK